MPTVYVHGQKLYYEIRGQGEPLLLMGGWMQVIADLAPLAAVLATDHTVYHVDLPGYGRSVPPFRTFPDDFYHRDAAIMAGFLDALDLTGVHIMGFSDGGETALLLGILRPQRCRSVVAWGAVGAFSPHLCEYVRQHTLPLKLWDEIKINHPGQNIDDWPRQWVEAFCAMIEAGGDVSLSRAAEIRCPLLLMIGDRDNLNPVADAQRYIEAATYRDSPARVLKVFEATGHSIHEERPEQFIAAVREFWRANPS
jgi:valacyclovir hydrolase